MIEQPPSNVAPDALFRLLLRTPRPTLPVVISMPGVAAGGAFSVRAITGTELFGARDQADTEPEPLRDRVMVAQLIALSLVQGGAPVFTSPAELGQLDEDDYLAVASVVLPAVATISPVYGLSDTAAWESRLVAGAQHRSNQVAAAALADCRERRTLIRVRNKARCYQITTTDRPDRYYGLPLGQLTDGHWLCYRAACRAHETPS